MVGARVREVSVEPLFRSSVKSSESHALGIWSWTAIVIALDMGELLLTRTTKLHCI